MVDSDERDRREREEVSELSSQELWSSSGGEIACRDHLGGYATFALRESPRLRKVETPITVWRRFSESGFACESCDRPVDPRRRQQ
jgi:hypothetical protein